MIFHELNILEGFNAINELIIPVDYSTLHKIQIHLGVALGPTEIH